MLTRITNIIRRGIAFWRNICSLIATWLTMFTINWLMLPSLVVINPSIYRFNITTPSVAPNNSIAKYLGCLAHWISAKEIKKTKVKLYSMFSSISKTATKSVVIVKTINELITKCAFFIVLPPKCRVYFVCALYNKLVPLLVLIFALYAYFLFVDLKIHFLFQQKQL